MSDVRRGDIYIVDHEPTKGREQQGVQPVLVVSATAHNRILPPVVVSISRGGAVARHAGYAVSLGGTGCVTHGVILCRQIRVLDFDARNAKRVESAPDYILGEVAARIAPTLGLE